MLPSCNFFVNKHSQRSILFKLSQFCLFPFPFQLHLTLPPAEGLWTYSPHNTTWVAVGRWLSVVGSWLDFALSIGNMILLFQRGTLHSPFIYSGISWVRDLHWMKDLWSSFFWAGSFFRILLYPSAPLILAGWHWWEQFVEKRLGFTMRNLWEKFLLRRVTNLRQTSPYL